MSTRRNGISRHQRVESFRGEGPNWILIAGGALLSTLSIRLGYKLKQSIDSKPHSNGTGGLKRTYRLLLTCPRFPLYFLSHWKVVVQPIEHLLDAACTLMHLPVLGIIVVASTALLVRVCEFVILTVEFSYTYLLVLTSCILLRGLRSWDL